MRKAYQRVSKFGRVVERQIPFMYLLKYISRSGNTSAGVPCTDRELASDIGESRDDPPVQKNCINAARKVDSGPVRPGSRSWPICLAMTAPALVLLPSHSYTQWGQLGEILGGVRFP